MLTPIILAGLPGFPEAVGPAFSIVVVDHNVRIVGELRTEEVAKAAFCQENYARIERSSE